MLLSSATMFSIFLFRLVQKKKLENVNTISAFYVQYCTPYTVINDITNIIIIKFLTLNSVSRESGCQIFGLSCNITD